MNTVKMIFVPATSLQALKKVDSSLVDDFWAQIREAKDLHSVYKKYPKGDKSNGLYAVEDKNSTKLLKPWFETFEESNKPKTAKKASDSSVFEAQLAMLQGLPQSAPIKKAIKDLIAMQPK